MMQIKTAWRWGLLFVVLLTIGGLLVGFPRPWPQFLAFLLVAVWPALSWFGLLRGNWQERLVMSAGLVLLINALLTLGFIYLPGPTPSWMLMAGLGFTALIPLPWIKSPISFGGKWNWRQVWLVILILCLTIALRWVNLGYSEFQGDESVIMTRAASLLTGDDAELFLHQKGPIEILLPLGYWGISQEINELWARVIFAWANSLSILALWLLARRWFGRTAGIFTALILVISGLSVAFGRIVQYQSLVMLWGAAALLMADRYAAERRRADLLLTAVFLAGGLLAHYDAILVAPAIAWILLKPVAAERKILWPDWLLALSAGGLVLTMFYLPFVLDPNFARTGQYLLQGRIGASETTGVFSWSGTAVWQMATLYNSTYYVVGLVVLTVTGMWQCIRRRTGGPAILYFLVPLLFYLLVVVDPRTHIYTFFPGAAVLGGVGAASLASWLQTRSHSGLFRVFGGIFAIWLIVSTYYVVLMFVDVAPERLRNWQTHRPTGYPTTWSEPPLYGLFGFPHQSGWRVVADLLPEDGYPYASNEEQEITDWYLKQKPRTHCDNFASFLLADQVVDVVPYDSAWLAGMEEQAEILVNGRSALHIVSRQPVAETLVREATGAEWWLTPAQAVPPRLHGENEIGITLGNEQVRLLGFDIDTRTTAPGGTLLVTLYWEALAPFDQNYQVFVHLFDGELRGQHDGAPECAIMPTTRWEPGQIIVDPHLVRVESDAPTGEIQIYTGMYNLITGERLEARGAVDGLIPLNSIVISDK